MKSEVINIKTPVSRVGNKTAILHILYALFPLHYGRFIDVFGGSGSVLLGKPTIDAFEVYNDFDRNLVNLFRCARDRPLALLRELDFLPLHARADFEVVLRFLSDRGIYVSSGSACHKGKPSHVYAALKLPKPQLDGILRISFSYDTAREDVDALVQGLKEAQAQLFTSLS